MPRTTGPEDVLELKLRQGTPFLGRSVAPCFQHFAGNSQRLRDNELPTVFSERDTTENTVKISDWFKAKFNAPKGLVPVDVKFTAEEQEAMNRALERFDAVVTNAHAPEGTRMFAPPKVANAISAQGLTEYVEDIQRKIQNSDLPATTASLMDKAVKAQMKAYALHNLPIYLFQLSGMYEWAGNEAKSQEFSQLFQRAQDEFEPDQIDKIFLELIETVDKLRDDGCDVSPTMKDQLNRVLVAKQLYDSGSLGFFQS